ncbi:MAG: glycosyltransferase [Chthoniobacterales bacterium]
MKTIVVSGAIANRYPYGGAAWGRLEWLLGFKTLGCNVYFVEQIAPGNCVDEAGKPTGFEQSANRRFFDAAMEQFDLADRAALIYGDGSEFHGLKKNDLIEIASAADLLVNISGHLNLVPLFTRFRRKAYVDVDPGYTQFWHAAGNPSARLAGHDDYFTIGQNIGTPGCTIPTCGIRWRRTWLPVALKHWPARMRSALDRFTTIASWRGAYGTSELGGKRFGPKAHEFRKFFELPERAPFLQFELALDIHSAEQIDLAALKKYGWRLVDPKTTAGDPSAFQSYIQNSGAEFSVAQPVYTETGSGWFSQRTAEYLASGKPVLVQDTGLGRHLPIGDGLLTFSNLHQAVDGVENIRANYAQHCRAARALAEEHFDSDKVLTKFLAEISNI